MSLCTQNSVQTQHARTAQRRSLEANSQVLEVDIGSELGRSAEAVSWGILVSGHGTVYLVMGCSVRQLTCNSHGGWSCDVSLRVGNVMMVQSQPAAASLSLALYSQHPLPRLSLA